MHLLQPFYQYPYRLLCSGSGEKGSMIITTDLQFPEWNQIFGDEKMTAALLDRITHNAHILITNGESYRLK